MADTYIYQQACAIVYSNGDMVYQVGDTPDPSKGTVLEIVYPTVSGAFNSYEGTYRTSVLNIYINDPVYFRQANIFTHVPNLVYIYGAENIRSTVGARGLDGFVSGATKLKHIYGLADMEVSGFTSISGAFSSCSLLDNINDIENWNMGTLERDGLYRTFSGCSALTTLDLSSYDLSKVNTLYNTFYLCKSLTTLNLGNIFTDCAPATGTVAVDLSSAFMNCTKLTTINDIFSNIPRSEHISQIQLSTMMRECYVLNTPIDLSGLALGNTYATFFNCYSIPSIDMSGCTFTTTNRNINNTFTNCYALETLDLSNIAPVASPSTGSDTFMGTQSLGYLDLSCGFYDTAGKSSTFFNNSGITSVTLGEGFLFGSAILPPGVWERESTGDTYSAAQLKSVWNSSMADTYNLVDTYDADNKYAIIYSNGDMVIQETNAVDSSRGEVLYSFSKRYSPSLKAVIMSASSTDLLGCLNAVELLTVVVPRRPPV